MHIVAGLFKNRRLKTPKGAETRPTMGMLREALFNISQHSIVGAHFLDLFAGSGAMGIEALSRGAAQVTFVDSSRESIRCITENLQSVNLTDSAQILQGDVFVKLQLLIRLKKSFDIIYIDPPYDNSNEGLQYCQKILQIIDETSLLRPGGHLFIEGPHPFDLHIEGLKSLIQEKTRRMGRATLQQYHKGEA